MIFRMQRFGPLKAKSSHLPDPPLTPAGFTPGKDEFPDILLYCLHKLLFQACLG